MFFFIANCCFHDNYTAEFCNQKRFPAGNFDQKLPASVEMQQQQRHGLILNTRVGSFLFLFFGIVSFIYNNLLSLEPAALEGNHWGCWFRSLMSKANPGSGSCLNPGFGLPMFLSGPIQSYFSEISASIWPRKKSWGEENLANRCFLIHSFSTGGSTSAMFPGSRYQSAGDVDVNTHTGALGLFPHLCPKLHRCSSES